MRGLRNNVFSVGSDPRTLLLKHTEVGLCPVVMYTTLRFENNNTGKFNQQLWSVTAAHVHETIILLDT